MPSISIDFFGSLSKNTTFWQELLGYAKEEGTKIHIISGLWQADLKIKLDYNGYIREVHYDSIHSILSYLHSEGLETWFDQDHDSWYSGQNEWWTAKARICQEIGCQIHFDSDIRFAAAFAGIPTRFVHTDNDVNKKLINQWHKDLKLANTYEDWENGYMSMMSGISPT